MKLHLLKKKKPTSSKQICTEVYIIFKAKKKKKKNTNFILDLGSPAKKENQQKNQGSESILVGCWCVHRLGNSKLLHGEKPLAAHHLN